MSQTKAQLIDGTSSQVSFIQSGTGAVTRTVDSKLKDWVNVKDFGATGDGITNDTTAIQNALNSGAKTIYAEAGTYKVTGQLTVPATVSLIGEGRNATIFTAEGVTTATFADTAVIYKAGGAPTSLPSLSSNPTKASQTLLFSSAHGLVVGDAVLIYNPTDGSFNASRANYRAGEYCTVARVVSSTEVELENGLYSAYTAAAVTLYKCGTYCNGSLQGFTVIAPGPGTNGIVRAIAIDFGHKVELEDLGARNSDNASMSISKCYKVTARSLDCFQWSESPGFGTQYGLSIGNAQELDISGSFVGFRHGIAYGGGNDYAVPCRAGVVHDFIAKNNNGSLAAADWHGNCEWCVYENGQVYDGGLNIAGNNNRISGIKAYGPNMMLILGREILGCNHVVENIECYTGRNDTTRPIINVGGNETPMDATITQFGGQYIFRNIFLDAPNNTTSAISIRNRGFAAASFDILVNNLTYVAPSVTNVAQAGIRADTVSGNAPARIQATQINVIGGSARKCALGSNDTNALVRQDGLTGLTTVTTTTGVAFVDVAVSFAIPFAKAANVVTNTDNESTGSDRCSTFARLLTTTGFTARYRRVDDAAANFTNAATRTIYWQANLQEW